MREFKDVIGKLGEMSANDIAAHFEEHGIKARPMAAFSCAVAVYVKQETGADSVGVDQESIGIYDDTSKVELGNIKTPTSVASFISRFDLGKYPTLVHPMLRSKGDNGA